MVVWFGLRPREIGSRHTLERGREERMKERSGQVKEERENKNKNVLKVYHFCMCSSIIRISLFINAKYFRI